LLDLGSMAVQILATVLERAGAGLRPPAELAVLRQFLPGPVPMDRVVPTVERPPAGALR
jgi:glucosyl-3-phosphoglycerate synthase